MKNTLLAIATAWLLTWLPVYAGSPSDTQARKVRANVDQVMNEVPIPTVSNDSIIVFQSMKVNSTNSLHPDHKAPAPIPMSAASSPTLVLASSPTMSDGVQNLLESHRTALQGILWGWILLWVWVFWHRRLRRSIDPSQDATETGFLESKFEWEGEAKKHQKINDLLEVSLFKKAYDIIQWYYPQDNASDNQESDDLPRKEAIDLFRRMLEVWSLYQSLDRVRVLEYYRSLWGEWDPEPKNEGEEIEGNFQDYGIDLEAIWDINYFEEAKVSFSLNQHWIWLGQLKKYFSKLNSDNKVELKKVKKLLNKTQLEWDNEIVKLELLASIEVKLWYPLDIIIGEQIWDSPNRVSSRPFDFGASITWDLRTTAAPSDITNLSDKQLELLMTLTTWSELDQFLFNNFIEWSIFSDDDKIATCNYLITEIIKVDVNVLEFIWAINWIANQELRDKISREIIRHNKEIWIKKKRLIKKVSFLRKPIIAMAYWFRSE